jgi:hypothetical protein
MTGRISMLAHDVSASAEWSCPESIGQLNLRGRFANCPLRMRDGPAEAQFDVRAQRDPSQLGPNCH